MGQVVIIVALFRFSALYCVRIGKYELYFERVVASNNVLTLFK
jgi:hypothetical protein